MVDEDGDRLGLAQVAGELAQRLAHQAGLQTHVGVAHLAFDLGARCERRHRVDDNDIDRTRTSEHVGDFERLFTCVRLRNQQLVNVDADRPGVDRIHGVLGIDVGTHATVALGLSDDMHGECGLARRLGTINLGDAPTRQTADTEREVKCQRTGRHDFDRHVGAFAHFHDRAAAELLVDLRQRHLQRLVLILLLAVCCHVRRSCLFVLCVWGRGPKRLMWVLVTTVKIGCHRVDRGTVGGVMRSASFE